MSPRAIVIALGLALLLFMIFFPATHGGMMFWLLLALGLWLLFNFNTAPGEADGCGNGA